MGKFTPRCNSVDVERLAALQGPHEKQLHHLLHYFLLVSLRAAFSRFLTSLNLLGPRHTARKVRNDDQIVQHQGPQKGGFHTD